MVLSMTTRDSNTVATEVVSLFEAALKNDAEFPATLTGQEISLEAIVPFASKELVQKYRYKQVEKEKLVRIAKVKRKYCMHKTPSEFSSYEPDVQHLSVEEQKQPEASFDFCSYLFDNDEHVCNLCGEPCYDNEKTFDEQHWKSGICKRAWLGEQHGKGAIEGLKAGRDYQECPNPSCRTEIELESQCNHMRCGLCKTEFCYLCGAEAGEDSGHWDPGSECPRWGPADSANATFSAFVPQIWPEINVEDDEAIRPIWLHHRSIASGFLDMSDATLHLARLCQLLAEWLESKDEPVPLWVFAGQRDVRRVRWLFDADPETGSVLDDGDLVDVDADNEDLDFLLLDDLLARGYRRQEFLQFLTSYPDADYQDRVPNPNSLDQVHRATRRKAVAVMKDDRPIVYTVKQHNAEDLLNPTTHFVTVEDGSSVYDEIITSWERFHACVAEAIGRFVKPYSRIPRWVRDNMDLEGRIVVRVSDDEQLRSVVIQHPDADSITNLINVFQETTWPFLLYRKRHWTDVFYQITAHITRRQGQQAIEMDDWVRVPGLQVAYDKMQPFHEFLIPERGFVTVMSGSYPGDDKSFAMEISLQSFYRYLERWTHKNEQWTDFVGDNVWPDLGFNIPGEVRLEFYLPAVREPARVRKVDFDANVKPEHKDRIYRLLDTMFNTGTRLSEALCFIQEGEEEEGMWVDKVPDNKNVTVCREAQDSWTLSLSWKRFAEHVNGYWDRNKTAGWLRGYLTTDLSHVEIDLTYKMMGSRVTETECKRPWDRMFGYNLFANEEIQHCVEDEQTFTAHWMEYILSREHNLPPDSYDGTYIDARRRTEQILDEEPDNNAILRPPPSNLNEPPGIYGMLLISWADLFAFLVQGVPYGVNGCVQWEQIASAMNNSLGLNGRVIIRYTTPAPPVEGEPFQDFAWVALQHNHRGALQELKINFEELVMCRILQDHQVRRQFMNWLLVRPRLQQSTPSATFEIDCMHRTMVKIAPAADNLDEDMENA
ncbi:Hypothetical predicted protein [Lecanosticta acicola]|uniref:RING-type domain-containing protein n=1 Tax=Lecanosticta acicola TaxID=111012 RepID=A0AAI8YYH0_9PEZI|nr:Hypothetical predicted protein [Lecanosticta acicola]